MVLRRLRGEEEACAARGYQEEEWGGAGAVEALPFDATLHHCTRLPPHPLPTPHLCFNALHFPRLPLRPMLGEWTCTRAREGCYTDAYARFAIPIYDILSVLHAVLVRDVMHLP